MDELSDEVEVAIEDATAEQEQPQNSFLYAATGQTPWWIVSILLHGLVIVLAGLMTMTLDLGKDQQAVIMVQELLPVQEARVEPPKPTATIEDLAPTNPIVTPQQEKTDLNVFITKAMEEMAEVAERMESNNPNELDENGFKGHPDHQIIFNSTGSNDPDGGGGMNGLEIVDDLIGSGPAGIGAGGGEFGGEGKGRGLGKGLGDRSWGNGKSGNKFTRFKSVGMTRATEGSVEAALSWLAYHQEADGSWNAKKYGASVKTDTAVTGFALLAFLGAGHTEKFGGYKENVKKAVAWIKSKQDAEGMIWDTTDDSAHHRAKGYPCAIASLALIEAGGMANIPETRAAAQKAVDYMCNVHQFGDGYDKRGWRYAPKSEGDLSVTGWFVMALKSAKVCGFSVPEASMDGAIKFVDSVEAKEQAGADSYGTPSRFKYMVNQDHMDTAHRLTAIGTLVRQFTGVKAEQLQATTDWFVNKGGLPSYGANGEKVDLYYWYYASLATYQQHKVQPDLWKRWCEAMKTAIVDNQAKVGDDRGSWNPVGDYSGEWGRVGQTALNALCLEVWYRYRVMDGGVN